jgi:hypothetical protein
MSAFISLKILMKVYNEEFRAKTGMLDEDITPLESIVFTEEGVKKLLKDLSPNKASEPDCIGPRVLKESAEEVTPALVALFQSSMTSGEVLSDWKDALMTQHDDAP